MSNGTTTFTEDQINELAALLVKIDERALMAEPRIKAGSESQALYDLARIRELAGLALAMVRK